jgi:hypothetical protein
MEYLKIVRSGWSQRTTHSFNPVKSTYRRGRPFGTIFHSTKSVVTRANDPETSKLPLRFNDRSYHSWPFLVLIGESQVVLVSQQKQIF